MHSAFCAQLTSPQTSSVFTVLLLEQFLEPQMYMNSVFPIFLLVSLLKSIGIFTVNSISIHCGISFKLTNYELHYMFEYYMHWNHIFMFKDFPKRGFKDKFLDLKQLKDIFLKP